MEKKPRLIFHCDCNNFFASCEILERPELRDVPMAVAGDPENRLGVVVARNELAKKSGVKTTDTVWQAKKKCPGIMFVPPRHYYYKEVSDRVNAIYRDYTDFVEPASIDESYLDMTGAPEFYHLSPRELADTVRERVRREIGITISVGVSFNKVFAKMGSDYKKPDATTVITEDNFKEILWPLPVSDLLFAILAGFAIMPAVFASGIAPSAGPGLVFETLPYIFAKMGTGGVVISAVVAILFFITILVAALTSSISMMEVGVAYLSEEKGLSRAAATAGIFLFALAVGIMCALKGSVFDFLDKLCSNFLLTLGALLFSLFVGWKMEKEDVKDELTNGGTLHTNAKLFPIIYFLIKYVAPVSIAVIFISGLLG